MLKTSRTACRANADTLSFPPTIELADPRLPASKAAQAQRSINLAMSSRGIAAIASVDAALAERFMDTVVPMKGRMIHDAKGRQSSQLYDTSGQVCRRRSLLFSQIWLTVTALVPKYGSFPQPHPFFRLPNNNYGISRALHL